PGRAAADPGQDDVPRQPLLVRRDAVVHYRAHRGDRAALQGARPEAALPGAVERPLPWWGPGAVGDPRWDRDVRGVAVGCDPEARGAPGWHPLDGARHGRLPAVPPPDRRRPARRVPDRARPRPGGIPRARL